MSSPFRSNNPLDYDAVDGIVIDESAPPPSVQGVGTGVAILVGQFERGLAPLADTAGVGDIYEKYGKNYNYSGLLATLNKKFSLLRIVRVVASDAVQAAKTFASAVPTDTITFKAKQGKGAFGLGITVAIAAGTNSGKKYTITDTNTGAVLGQEVYDDVTIATVVSSAVFAGSKLIEATVLSTVGEPANVAATALLLGADGTVANSDYSTAIDLCAAQNAGNVLFLDAYNATRNGYLKLHAAATTDKMVILATAQGTSRAAVVTDVAGYRDTEGRLIYAHLWLQTLVNGVLTYTSPASWYASIISQTGPNIDPADADNIKFLQGVTGIEANLSRVDYIALKQAGVSAFEFDSDLGYKIRSGIVTQIANSSKVTVARRRMADYLTDSFGKFFKLYQNGQNALRKRNAIKAAMLDFIKRNEDNEILPRDSEVKTGKAKQVDTESLNTDSSIAAGLCKILYKQRTFSSMRFIVLQAEIGESVVVTEE